ncbi:MAG: hypothetical protein H6656_18295 [Ardenticatenaceae bacterium]|nr:hypothetical protein [Ardenticatenaceae bacterium]
MAATLNWRSCAICYFETANPQPSSTSFLAASATTAALPHSGHRVALVYSAPL